MNSFFKFAGILFLAFFLSSCASGPQFGEVQSTFSSLKPGNGRIFVYRISTLGAAVQPDVALNGEKIGDAEPQGFFYVDRPAGSYEIMTSTEVDRKLSFTLESGQTRYIRLNVSWGFFVGHVYPKLVDESEAMEEITMCKYSPGE